MGEFIESVEIDHVRLERGAPSRWRRFDVKGTLHPRVYEGDAVFRDRALAFRDRQEPLLEDFQVALRTNPNAQLLQVHSEAVLRARTCNLVQTLFHRLELEVGYWVRQHVTIA